MATSATELKGTDYVHPEVLVDTQWVADHLNDPKVKIVEVDVDTSAYEQYEKQEGDFVEGEVPAEAPEALEPAETTVPPDEESR